MADLSLPLDRPTPEAEKPPAINAPGEFLSGQKHILLPKIEFRLVGTCFL
jgi:hypothetical protein